MTDLKKRGITAFGWDLFGKIITKGIFFIVSIFLARLLEPSDFGLIAIIMVLIGMASVFTDVGLGSALIQRRRTVQIHYSSVFFFNVFSGALLSLITYLSASLISEFYRNTQLIPLVQVMAFSFILGALSSVQSTKLRKELNYKLLTKIGLFSSLVGGVVGIYVAVTGGGVWSLVMQSLISQIIYNILIWTLSEWRPGFKFSFKALHQLWGFGFRIFLSNLIDVIFRRFDYLIIGKIFPPATLGYFQRSVALNSLVVEYSSGSLMAVLFPVLSKIQNDLQRFQNTILKSLGVICFITFFLIGVLYLNAEELIILLFSDKWLLSVEFFEILILSSFAVPIGTLLMSVFSSRGNSKVFLRLEIYKKMIAIVNLIILVILGIEIYLYTYLLRGMIGLILNIFFVSREIKLSFNQLIKPIFTQMCIAVVAVLLTIFIIKDIEQIKILMLILKGTVFTFVYILANYIIQTSSYKYFVEQVLPIIKINVGEK